MVLGLCNLKDTTADAGAKVPKRTEVSRLKMTQIHMYPVAALSAVDMLSAGVLLHGVQHLRALLCCA